jgi:hypothetical protein
MRRRHRASDPFAVLGLSADATLEQVEAARRTLAKSAHPDLGGSVAAMQGINAAADEAVRILALASGSPGRASDEARSGRTPAPSTAPPAPPPGGAATFHGPRFARRDHPSFTIEALPAEAFEGLLIVATWLGEVIDDDPPYALEVAMTHPHQGWCRLDVVPDAGSSTVSLIVAGEPGMSPPDLDAVRDAWIDGLNQLDWTDLAGTRPPP